MAIPPHSVFRKQRTVMLLVSRITPRAIRRQLYVNSVTGAILALTPLSMHTTAIYTVFVRPRHFFAGVSVSLLNVVENLLSFVNSILGGRRAPQIVQKPKTVARK